MVIRRVAARELLTHKGNQQETSLIMESDRIANRQLIMQPLHNT
jgi:hypothetical protein